MAELTAEDAYRSRTKSASDACAEFLREQIVSGSISDGAPVVIDRVASILGASHTPVREAIRRLEAEGLVTYEPNKGARVRGLSLSEFDELVGLRLAIEPDVLGKAIANASPGDFAPSDAKIDNWQTAVGSKNMLLRQWQFFRSLYEPSGLVRTLEVIDANWRLVERYHQFAWQTSDAVRAKDRDLQRDILRQCRARESKLAQAALIRSIEWGASLVRQKIA